MNDTAKPTRPAPRNDNAPPEPRRTFLADLVMGLRFYSRLPAGAMVHEPPSLNRMAPALPFTSLIIGIAPALILGLATLFGMPPLFAATLAVAASALVTGAMAEDAIADAADGLFGAQTPGKRLEILKDSRHGTYGVTALVLFLALRVVGYGALAATNLFSAVALWLAVTVLARSGALWLPLSLPPARLDGASATAGQISRTAFFTGLGFAVVIGFILAAPITGAVGFVAMLAIQAIIVWGWTWICRRLVGGQTGDLIGALQALLEIAALSTLMLALGPRIV